MERRGLHPSYMWHDGGGFASRSTRKEAGEKNSKTKGDKVLAGDPRGGVGVQAVGSGLVFWYRENRNPRSCE